MTEPKFAVLVTAECFVGLDPGVFLFSTEEAAIHWAVERILDCDQTWKRLDDGSILDGYGAALHDESSALSSFQEDLPLGELFEVLPIKTP